MSEGRSVLLNQELPKDLADLLRQKREAVHDDFRPAGDIITKWRYFDRNEV